MSPILRPKPAVLTFKAPCRNPCVYINSRQGGEGGRRSGRGRWMPRPRSFRQLRAGCSVSDVDRGRVPLSLHGLRLLSSRACLPAHLCGHTGNMARRSRWERREGAHHLLHFAAQQCAWSEDFTDCGEAGGLLGRTLCVWNKQLRTKNIVFLQVMLRPAYPEDEHKAVTVDAKVRNGGVPYCDSFHVVNRYCLTRRSSRRTGLKVTSQVVYDKSIFFPSKSECLLWPSCTYIGNSAAKLLFILSQLGFLSCRSQKLSILKVNCCMPWLNDNC